MTSKYGKISRAANRGHRRALLTAINFCAGLALVGPALAEDRPSAPASTGQVEEVTVTAEKRSVGVQKVPISITALSEQKLERTGVESVADIGRLVPSLSVVSSGPGENQIIIRGISSTAGTAATVGYYIDETPVSASSSVGQGSTRGVIDPGFADIARVEVLRGPQGTLYGSSSMGGTVRYLTNQPDLTSTYEDIGSSVSGTQGGGFNYSNNALVNAPLVPDVLALRTVVFQRHEDGYIDRYETDPKNYLAVETNGPVKKDVNTEDTYGGRMSLLYQPDGSTTITPSIYYEQTKLGAPYTIDVPPGSTNNLIQSRLVDEPETQRAFLANVTAKKSLDYVDLLSSTSYYDRALNITDDASKVIDFFFSSVQSSVYPIAMRGNYFNKEFTQEFRAASTWEGPLQGVAGLYYHYVRAPLESSIPVPAGYNEAFGSPFGNETLFAAFRDAVSRERAVFTELNYEILDGLKFTAGVRGFNVTQKFSQGGSGVLNGGDTLVSGTSSDTGVDPKFGLSYQATPDILTYATASKGFRQGGPNNPAPAAACGAQIAAIGLSSSSLTKYQSDSLWNYEVGAKTAWFDKSVTVNGSLYYIDWDKVQQQIDLNCGFDITANFGKAVSRGGELEVSYVPLDGLTLSSGAGYSNAVLLNSIPGTSAEKGDRLLDSPHWTLNVAAEYDRPLPFGPAAFVRLDQTYTSSANNLYDRTSAYYQRPGFAVTNFRAGMQDGRWQVSFFIDNLFNRIAETSLPEAISADLSDQRRETTTRPRTIGLSGKLTF